MGVKAEIRYQKLNRRQIDEMSKKTVHPWIEIMRYQQAEIKELKQEVKRLSEKLNNANQGKDKATKAYHRRNAEVKYLKFVLSSKPCTNCGEDYEANSRLNDGFCDDCRAEINKEGFSDD